MKKLYFQNRLLKCSLLFCFLVTFFTSGLAQNRNSFIEFIQAPELTQQQNHYAQAWIKFPYVLEYAYCNINIELLQNETFQIDLVTGNQISIAKRKVENRTNKMFSWFGDPLIGNGNINFVVNNKNVTGWIFCREGTYYIYPIGDGLHIMFHSVEDGVLNDKNDVDKNFSQKQKGANDFIDPETGVENKSSSSDCKVRVAVCYTDDVATEHEDIASFIQQCIDVTNEIFLNSDIYFEVELARSYENNYAEPDSNVQTLNEWKDLSDGILDEISTIRTYYDADVNVLLVSNLDDACGRAATDNVATSLNNFCSLQDGCATGNQYTFPHEIAHLFGCNHDTFITGDLLPYSYGHGKTNPFDAGGWRTVMAYQDYCDTIGLTCGRIPYFSNPDIDYEGVSTGTPFEFGEPTCDNARVLENSASAIASIEFTLENKSLPSENVYHGEAGNVNASLTCTHSGDYSIYSGGSMNWIAGESLTLVEGFFAETGSDFSASLGTCDALRIASENTEQEFIYALIRNVMIYPNPFDQYFNIDFLTPQKNLSAIEIYDAIGNRIYRKVLLKQDESHLENIKIDASFWIAGIYLVKIITENSEATYKISKMH